MTKNTDPPSVQAAQYWRSSRTRCCALPLRRTVKFSSERGTGQVTACQPHFRPSEGVHVPRRQVVALCFPYKHWAGHNTRSPRTKACYWDSRHFAAIPHALETMLSVVLLTNNPVHMPEASSREYWLVRSFQQKQLCLFSKRKKKERKWLQEGIMNWFYNMKGFTKSLLKNVNK